MTCLGAARDRKQRKSKIKSWHIDGSTGASGDVLDDGQVRAGGSQFDKTTALCQAKSPFCDAFTR